MKIQSIYSYNYLSFLKYGFHTSKNKDKKMPQIHHQPNKKKKKLNLQ